MKIIIDGAGEVGSHLARKLRADGNAITVIDDNASRLEQLSAVADVDTCEGGPSSIDTLRSAGVQDADLFIAVYPLASQEVNVVAAVLAKHLGAEKVIARVNDEACLNPENKLIYKEMGIDLLSCPERSASDEIIEQLRHSESSETLDFARGKLQVSVFKLDENSPVLDYKLSDFNSMLKPGESSLFKIIAITRDSRTIIPGPDTKFFFGDMVFAISVRDGASTMASYFGKERVAVEKVMILGGGQISEMVARSLSAQGISVKIVEADRERCIGLSQRLPDDVMVVNGDGRNSDFLFEENIADNDAFIALTSSDESNVLACVVAKKFGVHRTVAEVENIEYLRLAEEMGVDCVINKKMTMAGRIFKFTLSGKARFVKYMTGTEAEVIEYTVAPGSPVTREPIGELEFPEGAVLGGVIRGNDSFIAGPDTLVEAYDRVAVFSLPDSLKAVDRFFN